MEQSLRVEKPGLTYRAEPEILPPSRITQKTEMWNAALNNSPKITELMFAKEGFRFT